MPFLRKGNRLPGSHLGTLKKNAKWIWTAVCDEAFFKLKSSGFFKPVPPPRQAFDRVGIDHIGPFQPTKRGNRYLIVAVDYLTKWVEARPVPSTDAQSTCRFVRENLVARHGVPKAIVSDNGAAFTADTFRRLCESFGIRHTLVTPA